ncbi:FAD-dependent oxidoreductase [Thermomonospora umbrina]|uniref:2-polyprenyl-6-methoxyphenol hydroxylase-like FAD-dependent oxidoreductase n=1 Tax=Thermomonospora umbrina TaxID=111806 RepID=A0A3D9T2W0_9ACTN|nr:FAD-dependent oxidoreductase [Thermomonospora umbrina]REF00704.1 2-polyprenyl-6-methoxyphenol hydroxylase-like FAD-dependent oxidoreductase [Thermomonospora umbrina]
MDSDVVVVGGGPSGLLTAAELAHAGARVTVLERRREPVASRAGTILPRVLEILDSRGLAGRFVERARALHGVPTVPVHMWAGLGPVHWHHLGSRFGFGLILPQGITEEILLDHARRQGADIRQGAVAERITQDDHGVQVGFRDGDDRAETITARYVVGADGARSVVRRQAGIGFEGHDATFTGIVADARMEFPFGAAGHHMTDNEHGWCMTYPFGDGTEPITRFVIVHAQRRAAPQNEPVTADEVRRCLHEIFETPIEVDELAWASRYTDAQRIAPRFRDGRVLLVGEAARVHYPASGVGMNFCLQDAFNLGWKLAAVVNGHAGEALLDSYESERRPVALELLESVESQGAVQHDFTPEGITFKRMYQREILPIPEVNRRTALELNGLLSPYPAQPGAHRLTGMPAPDLELLTATGTVRIGELLREHAFVLVDLTDGNTYRDLGHDPALVGVVTGVPVLPPAELAGVRSLLVRPDGYVAWADDQEPVPDSATTAINNWISTAR